MAAAFGIGDHRVVAEERTVAGSSEASPHCSIRALIQKAYFRFQPVPKGPGAAGGNGRTNGGKPRIRMQGSPQTPSPSSLSPSPSTSSCAQVIARRSSGQFCVVLDLISYAWANRARLRAGSKESEDLARMMLMLDRKTFNMQNKASPSPNLAPTFDSGSPGPASRPGEKEGSEYFGCRDLAINRKRKRRCANSLGGFAKQTPPRCQTVFKHPELSIMIFRLPVGSRIPIHDHEGMTVLSHLLYGRMISTEYDWVDKKKGSAYSCPTFPAALPSLSPTCNNAQFCFHSVARLDFNGVLEAGKCDVHVVGENYRNCHSFQALSECAVLDIITPSYSKESPPKFFLAKPLRLDKTDKGGHTEGNAQTKLHHEFVGKKKNQSKHAQELGKLFTLKEYFPTDFSCCEEQYLGALICSLY
eukprot:6784-Amorphochlora_amoeboformis.AAC.1